MRRLIKWAAIGLPLAFVAIQFVPVQRTNPPVEAEVTAPPEVRAVLRRHPGEPTLIIGMYVEQIKQIAGELGITETTVKVHRSNMMRKIQAASLAELCRMVDKLKMLPENSDEPS